MDVKIGIVPQAGDLSRALDEIGQKYIYGSLEKLVQTMPEGSVIFALADQYPTPNLDVKEEILAQTAQKQIKLFLEYPRRDVVWRAGSDCF